MSEIRDKVNQRELKKKYNIRGYVGERFSIFFSKKWRWHPRTQYPIGIWKAKDGQTIFFIFLWLQAIYIPLSTYKGH